MIFFIAELCTFQLQYYVFLFCTKHYNASFGGKIVMFLANSLLGITLMGWIILLVIATSRNRKEKYKQEMMHYVKQK